MTTTKGYKIETLNKGTLFCVSDDYNMYGNYYKTKKGAEKFLKELLNQAGY